MFAPGATARTVGRPCGTANGGATIAAGQVVAAPFAANGGVTPRIAAGQVVAPWPAPFAANGLVTRASKVR